MKKVRVFKPARLNRKPSSRRRNFRGSRRVYEVRYDSVVTIKLDGFEDRGAGGAGWCGAGGAAFSAPDRDQPS